MTKKLPIISGRKALKAFSKMGSHVTIKKGNIGCTVPLHPELDKGTLDNILKQAKVDRKEFLKYLIVILKY